MNSRLAIQYHIILSLKLCYFQTHHYKLRKFQLHVKAEKLGSEMQHLKK